MTSFASLADPAAEYDFQWSDCFEFRPVHPGDGLLVLAGHTILMAGRDAVTSPYEPRAKIAEVTRVAAEGCWLAASPADVFLPYTCGWIWTQHPTPYEVVIPQGRAGGTVVRRCGWHTAEVTAARLAALGARAVPAGHTA